MGRYGSAVVRVVFESVVCEVFEFVVCEVMRYILYIGTYIGDTLLPHKPGPRLLPPPPPPPPPFTVRSKTGPPSRPTSRSWTRTSSTRSASPSSI